MSGVWDWWWNNIGGGGIKKGFEKGEKAGEKAGGKVDKATGTPDLPGAMSALSDTLSFSKAVWLNVSDYRMWRSLGWLLLGLVLMVIGFLVWNRKALEAVGRAVPL